MMNLVENATRPLRAIMAGSNQAAGALQATRNRLRQLNDAQRDVSGFRELRTNMGATADQAREARARVAALAQGLHAAGPPTAAMVREFEQARQAARALSDQQRQQHIQLAQLRTRLSGAGIDTRNLSQHERELRANIQSTTAEMERQQRALTELAARQRRLNEARARMEATQRTAGRMAGAGAAAAAGGAATGAALSVPVRDYAQAEDAATSLEVAMMRANGRAGDAFEKINALATKLGDRLPGTTADFQDLMTMLNRQGISAQSILGGMGESAAYLAVLLKKTPQDAAEFSAKLQDATKTSESDMLSLMDVIQRTYYLGVDDSNMLAGMAKLSPAMDTIKQKGLEGARVLAPLLVMADQAGMQGEAAGNAYRKIFQMSLNADKLAKANKSLSPGRKLDFSDGTGEWGGLDKMFKQFEKLKGLTTQDRLSVLKEIYGDDAETLQVVSLLMEKGVSGYAEVQARMANQASLQQRVNRQLGTLKNLWEATTGTFTNTMVAFGAAIAPELKAVTEWLGNAAQGMGRWAKENPRTANGLMKLVAAIAILLTVCGAFLVMLGAVLGPLAMLRFSLVTLGIQGAAFGKVLTLLGGGLRMAGQAVLFLGRAMLMNPIGLAVTAIALSAYLIYKYWGPIKGFFSGLWDHISNLFNSGVAWFSQLPARFFEFGSNLVSGLVNGITSRMGAVKETIENLGGGAVTWFKEKLGIRSPSRVFGELGGFVGEGAAIGMEKQTGRITTAAAGLATAATLAFTPAAAQPFQFAGGARGAAAAGAPGAAAGGPTTINIYAQPGQDAAAIARAVSAELDRRGRDLQARNGSRLSD
jgi:TP901 family phage tail tape measure protein